MRALVVLALILLISIPIAYFFIEQSNKKPLPILNPNDVQQEMVDSTLRFKGHGHRIGTFNLLDQHNKPISDKIIDGKVVVAEYFFTTCKSICPIMNRQMQRVQDQFNGEDRFEILSFTVDPEKDTPQAMLAYAKSHSYTPGQWHFITGPKEDLYKLARTSFFVLKPAEAQNLGDAGSDFIHTNNFVLVDQNRQIRGYYDGTSTAEVNQLIDDIEILLEND